MKHLYNIPLLIGLLLLSGCNSKRKKIKPATKNKNEMVGDQSKVNIPVSGDSVRSFFDEEIEEFTVVDDTKADVTTEEESAMAYSESVVPQEYEDEFAWIEDDDLSEEFSAVYFDFDRDEVRPDQEEVINDNVARLVHEIELAHQEDKEPQIVIEGHSCSITKSRVYNLALSEKRAKVFADKLVDAGIPRDNIKIVGRGAECPAIIDGKPIDGPKENQWPNRRAEIHLIYS